MGILYDKSIERISSILIKDLAEMNVFRTVQDKSIYEADYEDLKETVVNAVLKRTRMIDISSDENRWF